MRIARYVGALLATVALGCEGPSADEAGDVSGDTATEGSKPTCELVSTTELAGVDTIAPNGRSGADILAVIPESFETTLTWDLSSLSAEVEVLDASGQSSALTLTFDVPMNPQVFFEDWEAMDASGEVVQDVDVVCDDFVRTAIGVSAETEDGALAIELSGLDVGFGPDHPETEDWAKPFIHAARDLSSPSVNFLAPVAQPADAGKTLGLIFDAPQITGSLTVYATSSEETYRLVVARW
ncbi:hypothetical protein G6O69_34480 [Pseudenhygromyxa sp. WMMC2535]|uniref:hypothetical protein n=1 Tax=Pseudenhygromyxa sp. WMMC2535 TaxID=2712867 RepID=UPI001552782A|nr:hypothetical protein [Pseudenhygromyxa sp. WMMC2535]NVB42980.1 hypothetical protein [Pseudenhygromyxa sp. WMMC2535]